MTAIRQPFWLPQLGPLERKLVGEVLDSNFLNDGKVTIEFEERLAALLGCRHVVAVTSGTAALALALLGLGVGAGDEVLVPDVTFIASANAVSLTGAKPVLVDVDPATLMIDPQAAERAITARTKAIMPVHVSGRTAAMPALLGLARARGLAVVEDAAEAFMSRAGGKCLGTFGNAGCLSFSPNKTIATGQGGAIMTDDEALYGRLRELKDQGRPLRGTGGADTHVSLGFNFKFTNLQAAIGLGQLAMLDARLDRLRAIYRGYVRELGGLRGLKIFPVAVDAGEVPQWVDVLIELADNRRDELDDYLLKHGAQCRRFWFPLHTQEPYRQPDANFPNASRLVPRALWLPSAFTLTDEDVVTVSRHVRAFFEGGARS